MKQTWWAEMTALCPLPVWWNSVCAPLRTGRLKCATSSTNQTRIVRFRPNFVQGLDTWHPKWRKWLMRCIYWQYSESSRSRCQRSRSQHDVKYQQQERARSQARIGWLSSNLVKIIPQRMFNVIGSNIAIAVTQPRIARLRPKFGTEFHNVVDDTLRMFKVTA